MSVRERRSSVGANMLEFSAAFTVLVVFVLLPLVDLAAVPIRTMFASSAVQDTVHRLALSSKFSDALAGLNDGSLDSRFATITGVSVVSKKLSLVANSSSGSSSFSSAGAVSESWLPDGKSGPYHYNLNLSCELDIAPLFLIGANMGADVPGLTKPFRVQLSESYSWENLSKDPSTQKFFLNE